MVRVDNIMSSAMSFAGVGGTLGATIGISISVPVCIIGTHLSRFAKHLMIKIIARQTLSVDGKPQGMHQGKQGVCGNIEEGFEMDYISCENVPSIVGLAFGGALGFTAGIIYGSAIEILSDCGITPDTIIKGLGYRKVVDITKNECSTPLCRQEK